MEKGDNRMKRYCCECHANISDKPIEITVCDSCKARRIREGHDIFANAKIKHKQGISKGCSGF